MKKKERELALRAAAESLQVRSILDSKINNSGRWPKYCPSYRLFLEFDHSLTQPLRTAVKVGGKICSLAFVHYRESTPRGKRWGGDVSSLKLNLTAVQYCASTTVEGC